MLMVPKQLIDFSYQHINIERLGDKCIKAEIPK